MSLEAFLVADDELFELGSTNNGLLDAFEENLPMPLHDSLSNLLLECAKTRLWADDVDLPAFCKTLAERISLWAKGRPVTLVVPYSDKDFEFLRGKTVTASMYEGNAGDIGFTF